MIEELDVAGPMEQPSGVHFLSDKNYIFECWAYHCMQIRVFSVEKTCRKLQEVLNNVLDFLCQKNLNLKIKNFLKEKKNFN